MWLFMLNVKSVGMWDVEGRRGKVYLSMRL